MKSLVEVAREFGFSVYKEESHVCILPPRIEGLLMTGVPWPAFWAVCFPLRKDQLQALLASTVE